MCVHAHVCVSVSLSGAPDALPCRFSQLLQLTQRECLLGRKYSSIHSSRTGESWMMCWPEVTGLGRQGWDPRQLGAALQVWEAVPQSTSLKDKREQIAWKMETEEQVPVPLPGAQSREGKPRGSAGCRGANVRHAPRGQRARGDRSWVSNPKTAQSHTAACQTLGVLLPNLHQEITHRSLPGAWCGGTAR